MAADVQMRQPYGHKMWFVVPYLNFAGANETETVDEVQEKFFFEVSIEGPLYASHQKN